jgi:hypothetical protein
MKRSTACLAACCAVLAGYSVREHAAGALGAADHDVELIGTRRHSA